MSGSFDHASILSLTCFVFSSCHYLIPFSASPPHTLMAAVRALLLTQHPDHTKHKGNLRFNLWLPLSAYTT